VRVRLGVGVGVEVEAGCVDVDSDGEGVLVLIAGLMYGLERLWGETFRTLYREEGNSRVLDHMFFPHNQTSVLLNAVAAKWEPLASDKLDKTSSVAGGPPSSCYSPREQSSSRRTHLKNEDK
jgi:hypothetical protein